MSFAQRFFTGLAKPLLSMFLADNILRYPGGDLSAPVVVRALIALDVELGTNEVPGDGAVTRDVHGDRERRTGRIEIPTTLPQIDTLTITSTSPGTVHSVTIGSVTVSYTSQCSLVEATALGLAQALRASASPAFAVLDWCASATGVIATGPMFTIASVSHLTRVATQAAGMPVSETDLWRIDGEIWTTIRQDARDTSPHAGYESWRITTKLGRRTQHSYLKEDRPIRRA